MSKSFLLITHSAAIGGASRSLVIIARSLLASGCRVHVLTPDGPACRIWRELGAATYAWKPAACYWLGGPVYSSGIVNFKMRCLGALVRLLWRLLTTTRLVRQIVTAQRIDTVHVNSLVLFPIGLVLALFCRRRGIRVIWHVREVLNETLPRLSRLMVIKSIVRGSDTIIAITRNEAKSFEHSGKVQVIHNTVSEDWLVEPGSSDRAEDPNVLVAMGCEFSLGKGIAEFVRMAELLRGRHPDVMFELYTTRPRSLGNLDELTLAARCNISACVVNPQLRLLFDRQLARQDYARFGIYVRADKSGCPWGRDIIEAMCSGVPVVATGSSQEFVVEGVTGFLTPPGSPELLAEAVERLLVDRALRSAMGRAARQRALALFSPTEHWQRMARALGVEASGQ